MPKRPADARPSPDRARGDESSGDDRAARVRKRRSGSPTVTQRVLLALAGGAFVAWLVFLAVLAYGG